MTEDAADDDEAQDGAYMMAQTRESAATAATRKAKVDPSESKQRRVTINENNIARLADSAEQVSTRIQAAADQAGSTVQSRLSGSVEPLVKRMETMTQAAMEQVSELRKQSDVRETRMKEEMAQHLATFQRMMKNMADSATNLKHAQALRDHAAEFGEASRAAADGGSAQALAVQRQPVSRERGGDGSARRSFGRRPSQPDGNGYYNTHVRKHTLSDLDSEGKELYKARGVCTDEQFGAKVAGRVCTWCPPDKPNMPHYEDQCSMMFPFTGWAVEAVGAARAAQMRERAVAKLTGTVSQLVAAAEESGDYAGAEAVSQLACVACLDGDATLDLLFATVEELAQRA